MPLSTASRRLTLITLTILTLTILVFASYAAAQAGSLDPTFGTGGIFISPTTRGNASAVAIQSDGKILIAGGGIVNNTLAAIITRLNTNGTIDTSFGSEGFATLENTASFFAMILESNGKILAAAEIITGNNGGYVELMRFNNNGTLDSTFGTGGITTTQAIPFTPFNATGAIALLGNGEILVAASSPGVMARFTSSGQLDTTFGTNGLVNLANVGPALSATAPACPTQILLQNGKILISAGVPEPTPAALATIVSRYNSNGSLDTSFAAAGMMATVVSASAMTFDSSGKLVIAGALTSKINAPPASNDVGFGIVRYHPNGVIDTSFGKGGVAVIDFGSSAPLAGAFALAIQSNGDIVAGGAAAQGPENTGLNSAFALTRVTSTGALDTTFGTEGIVTTTIVSGSEQFSFVAGLAIQSDGKIVAAGTTIGDEGFLGGSADVARYLAQ
jgi:uncharacterized delta-60 repeat protein